MYNIYNIISESDADRIMCAIEEMETCVHYDEQGGEAHLYESLLNQFNYLYKLRDFAFAESVINLMSKGGAKDNGRRYSLRKTFGEMTDHFDFYKRGELFNTRS